MRRGLRLFTGDTMEATPRVSISFGELRRIVTDAECVQRSWMRDFERDEVQIPEDLYEVLTAYRQLMPGA